EAHAAAREMWSGLLAERRDPTRCSFEVRSEDRELLFVLPFRELLESCRDHRRNLPFHSSYRQAVSNVVRARRINEEFQQELQRARKSLRESIALLKYRPPE